MLASSSDASQAPVAARPPAWRNPVIYFAAGWSGFFVMGVELLGGRLLSPYFGTSIFVWGALIAVFMTALAIGYLIGGQLSLRTPSMSVMGLLLMAEASLALPLVMFGDVVFDAISISIEDPRYGSLLASVVMFGLPTVFSGMVSPYAVRLLIEDLDRSGRSAGRLFFASTLGSAGGTIFTTFYLVLYFEIHSIILSLIAISFAIGVGLLAMDRRRAH